MENILLSNELYVFHICHLFSVLLIFWVMPRFVFDHCIGCCIRFVIFSKSFFFFFFGIGNVKILLIIKANPSTVKMY